MVELAARSAVVRNLEVEWLSAHPTMLVVQFDGQVVAQQMIPPGVSTIAVQPTQVNPTSRVNA